MRSVSWIDPGHGDGPCYPEVIRQRVHNHSPFFMQRSVLLQARHPFLREASRSLFLLPFHVFFFLISDLIRARRNGLTSLSGVLLCANITPAAMPLP